MQLFLQENQRVYAVRRLGLVNKLGLSLLAITQIPNAILFIVVPTYVGDYWLGVAIVFAVITATLWIVARTVQWIFTL